MEAFRFRVGLNSTEHTQKPTSKEASIINRNGFPTTETSLEELKTSLSKGMTFTPSYFKDGKRNNKNFEGTYVFALDFDDNQEPEEKIAQLKEYGIETNLYYPSFSDKPRHRKFRLVIVFDTPVEDKKSRDKIQLAIMEMVKDSDRACKDASRMFYGGATCELLSNKPNSLEERLIHLHNIINSTTVNKVTKGRNDNNLKKYTKTCISYNTIRDSRKSIQNDNEYDIKERFNYNQAKNNSKVFNSFANGGHLSYSVLFNLISNMQYVKGGLLWVKEIMDRAGSYNYSDYELLRTIRKYNYLPSNMIGFDSELVGEYSNVWHLDRTSNNVEVIERAEKYGSDVLYGKFSIFLERINNRHFLKQNNIEIPRINVCSVGVGIGKSHKLKRQLKQGKTVFAFPTHDLKREFEQDIQKYDVPYEVTPVIPKFNIEEVNTMYDNYQAMGEGLKANRLIRDVASGKHYWEVKHVENLEGQQDDIYKAQDYLKEMAKAYASEYCVLTTHQRALLTPNSFKNKDHFVFDEDLMDSLLTIDTIRTSQIVNMISNVKAKKKSVKADLQAICDHLNELTASAIVKTQDIVIKDLDALKKALGTVKGGAKIIKFIESDYVLRYKGGDDVDNFYCVTKGSLPIDKQITIASATADSYFYDRLMANEDYEFHFLGNAINNNNIIQYTGKRCSRHALTNGDIPDVESDNIVITYKNLKNKFDDFDEIVHFGNAEGYNHLKGKDLSVVGTPTRPVHIVMLYAKALGLCWRTKDLGFKKQTILYKGQGNVYKYSIHTYGDEGLANIDVRLAIKDLEQAVGRARANRTNSNVEIFSAIPTYSADKFKLRK